MSPPASPPTRNAQRITALKIVIAYLVVGGLYVLTSNQVLAWLFTDAVTLARVGLLKGWVFIGATALLLYWLIRRSLARIVNLEHRYRDLHDSADADAHLRQRELQFIAAIAAAVRATATRAEMLPQILDQLSSLFPSDAAAIGMVNESGVEVVVHEARGAWTQAAGLPIPLEQSLVAEVMRSGQPFVTANVLDDARVPDPSLIGDLPAIALVPLMADQHAIGVLALGSRRPFTPDEMHVVAAVGDIVANALQRTRAYEQASRRADQFAKVNALGRSLAELIDLPQVYEQLSVAIDQLLPGTHRVCIALFDASGQTLQRVYGAAGGRAVDVQRWPLGQPDPIEAWAREALQLQQSICVATMVDGVPQSSIVAPMLVKDAALGVVEVQRDAAQRVEREDTELLDLLITTAAVTIQNARLFEAERRQREHAEALAHLAARLNALVELDAVAQAICVEAAAALHAPAASVYLYQPDRTALTFAAGVGLSADYGARVQPMPRAVYDAMIDPVRGLVVVPDIRRVPNLPDAVLYSELNLATIAGAALVREGRLVGLLNVKSIGQPRTFAEDELGLLVGLANQAAIAVENAQLLAAERQQRALSEALRDTAAALNSTLNLDEILDRMLANIGRVVPHDAANIMLIDANGVAQIARCHGYDRISPQLETAVRQLRFTVNEVANLKHMVDTGEPFIVADSYSYPGWVEVSVPHWQRATLGAPIRLRAATVGFIILDSRHPDFFNASNADNLQLFAEQAGVAFENARLFASEREMRTLSEALRDTATALTGTLMLDEVLDRILANVGRIVPYDMAIVLQIDAEQDTARVVRMQSYLGQALEERVRQVHMVLKDTPILRFISESRQPIVIPSVADDPRWVDVAPLRWVRSHTSVPIVSKGQVVGVLSLDSATANFYMPQHAERLQVFAAQAATAVENAQLFDGTEQRMRELAALFESSLIIAGSLDRATVLNGVTSRLAGLVDATSSYVIECNWVTGQATVVAEYFGPQATERERVSDLGSAHDMSTFPHTLAALQRGEYCITTLSQPDADHAALDDLLLYGGKSSLRVPMNVAGQVRGYAVLWDSRTERKWTASEIRLCQTLANQAAVALENARLFDEMQQRFKEQSALLAASTAVSSSLDLPTVLQSLAEHIGRAIDVTSVYVCEWNRTAGTSKVVVDYYGPAATPRERVSDLGHVYSVEDDFGIDAEWLLTGEGYVIHVSDETVSDGRRRHLLAYDGKSMLTVSLIAKANVFGFIELWDSRQHRLFTPGEIALAQGIARQAAIAFENARLFEAERKQLRLAQTLQAVGALLTAEMNLDEVFGYLFDLLARVVSYDSVSIQLVEGENVQLVAGRGFPDLPLSHRIANIVGTLTLQERWGLPHRRYLVIPDTHRDPHWVLDLGNEYIHSWIGAALRVKGRLLGILNLDSATPNAYDEALGETVAAFANQAAIAIENAQLNEAVRRHAEELETHVVERTAELERERKRTAAVLDTAGEGIMLTDFNGRIEYMNPAMERITGFKSAEAVGRNPRLWQSGRTSPALYHEMWDSIKRGRIWQGELMNRRKDGQLYDAALTVAPLTDADGKIVGFVGVQRDISHQKELDRLKDEFVSNVSHELRTPIANVKLYLSLLTRGKPEKYDDYLQTLRRETARLETLIEDLLDLSQLDLSTTRLELEAVDLNQLLAQLVADRSALAASKQLAIDYQTEPGRVMALADVALLVQVASNLLTNAINYTPRGGTITVSIGYRPYGDQARATFTVRDTGHGISAADREHLFERFYRGEAGRRSGAPGTGLGLAISSKIADRLGGQITIDSQPGEGAAFTVWLPVAAP